MYNQCKKGHLPTDWRKHFGWKQKKDARVDNRLFQALSSKLKAVSVTRIQDKKKHPDDKKNSGFEKYSATLDPNNEVNSDRHSPLPKPSLHLVPDASEPLTPSVSSQFLNLFSNLKNARDPLLKSQGESRYLESNTKMRKTTKLSKGSMLDDEAA